MKTIITAVAATLFAASVNAADVYHGLDAGNSDLNSAQPFAAEFAGVQPGVGDSIDIYGALDDGNADLFRTQPTEVTVGGESPDIYMNLSGNTDLQF